MKYSYRIKGRYKDEGDMRLLCPCAEQFETGDIIKITIGRRSVTAIASDLSEEHDNCNSCVISQFLDPQEYCPQDEDGHTLCDSSSDGIIFISCDKILEGL